MAFTVESHVRASRQASSNATSRASKPLTRVFMAVREELQLHSVTDFCPSKHCIAFFLSRAILQQATTSSMSWDYNVLSPCLSNLLHRSISGVALVDVVLVRAVCVTLDPPQLSETKTLPTNTSFQSLFVYCKRSCSISKPKTAC